MDLLRGQGGAKTAPCLKLHPTQPQGARPCTQVAPVLPRRDLCCLCLNGKIGTWALQVPPVPFSGVWAEHSGPELPLFSSAC